jgi:hypothetical protein
MQRAAISADQRQLPIRKWLRRGQFHGPDQFIANCLATLVGGRYCMNVRVHCELELRFRCPQNQSDLQLVQLGRKNGRVCFIQLHNLSKANKRVRGSYISIVLVLSF